MCVLIQNKSVLIGSPFSFKIRWRQIFNHLITEGILHCFVNIEKKRRLADLPGTKVRYPQGQLFMKKRIV